MRRFAYSGQGSAGLPVMADCKAWPAEKGLVGNTPADQSTGVGQDGHG